MLLQSEYSLGLDYLLDETKQEKKKEQREDTAFFKVHKDLNKWLVEVKSSENISCVSVLSLV